MALLLRRRADERQPPPCAGIVDDDVGDALLALDALGDRLDVLSLRQVDTEGARLAASLPDSRGDLFEQLGVAGKENEPRASFSEELSRRPADPARCAGHQSELSADCARHSSRPSAFHAAGERLSLRRDVPLTCLKRSW